MNWAKFRPICLLSIAFLEIHIVKRVLSHNFKEVSRKGSKVEMSRDHRFLGI